MPQKSILMLLLKDFNPDPRVLKEAKSLGKRGYAVTIHAWKYKGNYAKEDYKEFSVKHLGPQLPDIYDKMPKLLQLFFLSLYIFFYTCNAIAQGIKKKFDILHAHDLNTLHIAAMIKIFKWKPLIYDSHEHYPSVLRDSSKLLYYFGIIAERILTLPVTAIVTTNDAIAEQLQKYKKPIFIVSNCIDLAWFDALANKNKAKQLLEKYNIKKDKPIILYEGIVKKIRGLQYLIEAKKYMKTDCIILIVGEGPYIEELKQIAKQSNADDVYILGHVPYDDIPNYILASDIGVNLLLPSFNNKFGNPNKIFEYLAGNVPLLVSNLPEMEKVVKEGNCGFVVDPSNPKDIAEKIDNFIKNSELTKSMGRNGRKIVEEKYNWEKQVDNLTKAYKSI
ncbi:glycosyltransferase family 4 protein [Candidatus Woesearchaeota archaeon]|nr:glycosyltransferase family 4 protein [Candidatus Woesearchaeota archaeon]